MSPERLCCGWRDGSKTEDAGCSGMSYKMSMKISSCCNPFENTPRCISLTLLTILFF